MSLVRVPISAGVGRGMESRGCRVENKREEKKMKGIYFDFNVGKALLMKMKLGGKYSMIKYKEDWPAPVAIEPMHVVAKTRVAGICASDIHQINIDLSFAASILASKDKLMPLGHETVATVEEVGPGVTRVVKGDRVIFSEVDDCAARGLPDCPSCKQGNHEMCDCLVGFDYAANKEAPFGGVSGGGFAERFIGHEAQFYKVPDGIPDDIAVLTEPFTIGLHAVARNMPPENSHVVVIGAGIIGLMTIAALRALAPRGCKIIAVARYPFQAEAAKRLGAGEVLFEKDRKTLYEQVATIAGGKLFKPTIGNPILYGDAGPAVVYDAVGTERSLDDSLHLVASNGTLVTIGMGFSVTKKIDWSLINYKEIRVSGLMMQDVETVNGKKVDTFELALDLIQQNLDLFRGLVTHKFLVNQYKQALSCARNKGKNKAIKVAFEYP